MSLRGGLRQLRIFLNEDNVSAVSDANGLTLTALIIFMIMILMGLIACNYGEVGGGG